MSHRKYRDMFVGQELPDTAMRYVLESMIPYTRANIALAFRPNTFFNDLERIDRKREYSRNTLRVAYYRAKRERLIAFDELGRVELTEAGVARLRPWEPKKLIGSHVMVIFDIPETQRSKRNQLRMLLRELKFIQIQKSVWRSNLDCAPIIASASRKLKIENFVQVYECAQIC